MAFLRLLAAVVAVACCGTALGDRWYCHATVEVPGKGVTEIYTPVFRWRSGSENRSQLLKQWTEAAQTVADKAGGTLPENEPYCSYRSSKRKAKQRIEEIRAGAVQHREVKFKPKRPPSADRERHARMWGALAGVAIGAVVTDADTETVAEALKQVPQIVDGAQGNQWPSGGESASRNPSPSASTPAAPLPSLPQIPLPSASTPGSRSPSASTPAFADSGWAFCEATQRNPAKVHTSDLFEFDVAAGKRYKVGDRLPDITAQWRAASRAANRPANDECFCYYLSGQEQEAKRLFSQHWDSQRRNDKALRDLGQPGILVQGLVKWQPRRTERQASPSVTDSGLSVQSVPLDAAKREREAAERERAIASAWARVGDFYGALAIDENQGSRYGWAVNHGSQAGANETALNKCKGSGGTCRLVMWFKNACAAYAADQQTSSTAYGWAWHGNSREMAERKAKAECVKRGGVSSQCITRVWGCTTTAGNQFGGSTFAALTAMFTGTQQSDAETATKGGDARHCVEWVPAGPTSGAAGRGGLPSIAAQNNCSETISVAYCLDHPDPANDRSRAVEVLCSSGRTNTCSAGSGQKCHGGMVLTEADAFTWKACFFPRNTSAFSDRAGKRLHQPDINSIHCTVW